MLLGPRIPVSLCTIISGYNTDTTIGLFPQRMSVWRVWVSIRISQALIIIIIMLLNQFQIIKN